MIITELKEKAEDLLAQKLIEYISAKVPDFSPAEHLDSSFSSLGLDSVAHVEITAMIEDHLQTMIDPALAFNYPTVNALIKYLHQNFTVTTNFQEENA